ncbi:MAG: ATP-dependent DNA helicase RecG [Omnitrophica WOR_2 bacterium GWA2_45_18]|nr:MAG: ATP-dependent DNA helicase RecG [Omnitrophica WOR_2 bacterium GWA2_45_18]
MKNLSDISIQYIKGVGPNRRKLFNRLGIESVEDLLYFFPRRYEDRRDLTPIAQLKLGEWQTISGTVVTSEGKRSWYTKKHVFEVLLDDKSGRLTCIWFNQPYLVNYFKLGGRVVCYGKVDMYKNSLQMISPEYEVVEEEEESLAMGRIVSVYPLTRGITQRYLRKTIKACLDHYQDQMVDELPVPLRNKHRLVNIKRSIHNIHFPESFEEQDEALRRLSFEEFYFFQMSIILRRLSITQKPGYSHDISDGLTLKFISAFPFKLTSAQNRVIREIRGDMSRPRPMLRLLQGDVGSGKTLVAFFGCVAAFENGFQSAIMAPTEILARQHYEKVEGMLKNGSFKDMRTVLLVSGLKKKEKEKIYQQIRLGEFDLIVGTHALINEEVVFKNLSFVVIDEQHKFGVRQRALLSEKGSNPDILIMTATPIPRTLCITLFGDLDVSIIDELPPGRGKVKTMLFSDAQSQEVYRLVREKVNGGDQAYIIYPIIEESATLDLKAAQQMYEDFKKTVFKGLRLGLVHGQMKRQEAQKIMDQFKNNQIDILVATTILEVGVDVPEANVMVIEHAERFGLSQLHQLRGRIGRGFKDGLCLLVAEPSTAEGTERLKAILSTHDGFKIAQHDLMIRGPGRYFGRHQHGLNELKVANPATQLDVLELARKEAMALLHDDPQLMEEGHLRIKQIIKKRYPTYLEMVAAG